MAPDPSIADHLFQICTRQQLLERCNQGGHNGDDLVGDYYSACFADLTPLSQLATGSLARPQSTSLRFALDPSPLFNAQIGSTNGADVEIRVSLGLFMACDDFAGIVLPYYVQALGPLDESRSRFIRDTDPRWSVRFTDYSRTFEAAGVSSLEPPFGGPYAAEQFQPMRTLISNTMLLWCLAHELGHWLLGHVGQEFADEGRVAYREITDSPARQAPRGRAEQVSLYYAREFEADCYATSYLAWLMLRKSNASTIYPGASEQRAATLLLVLIKNISSYLPLLFQRMSSRGNQFSDSLHPHPLARAFNSWVTFEMSHQGLLERFQALGVHARFEPADTIFAWLHVVPHVYYVSSLLGETFSTADKLRETLRQDLVEVSNEHKQLEACKLVLCIWHSRFALNFFAPVESPHAFVEQWRAHWLALGAGLGTAFGRYRPHLESDSAATFVADYVKEMMLINCHEAAQGLRDVETARKVFTDTAHVAMMIASFQGFVGATATH